MSYGGPPVIYKSPGVAAVLSFLYAGLGQIYNGQFGKGIVFIILCTFSLLLCAVFIGFLPAPIIWIWGMIGAYQSAQAINQRLWQQQQQQDR